MQAVLPKSLDPSAGGAYSRATQASARPTATAEPPRPSARTSERRKRALAKKRGEREARSRAETPPLAGGRVRVVAGPSTARGAPGASAAHAMPARRTSREREAADDAFLDLPADFLASERRASASGGIPELQYGAMAKHEGYLRQDTRPVPFVSVKVRRYARLEGTRLSLAKAPDGEVIWSFDIAGSDVEMYTEDRKISIWLTDSMHRRRRVIVLVAADAKQFARWSFWLRRASKSVLEMHYGMTRLINKGAFARVVLAKDLHTGSECAIKLIEKSNAPPSARRYMEREVQIMRLVRHRHIVKCLDIFDTRLRTRIVMEYMAGGMLSSAIKSRGAGLPERLARPILRGILEGVEYLHRNGIVHRDLKPDNCLLPSATEPFGDVKLSDFGLSNFVPNGAPYNGRLCADEAVLTSAVGSPGFVAPELFESTYGTAVDMWSVGVILYNMLSGGGMPFRGETDSVVLQSARKGRVNFADANIKGVSREARSLILGMLTVDVERRLTATQALEHPWLAEEEEGVPNGEPRAEAEEEEISPAP